MKSISVLVAALFLAPSILFADTVWMKNGDRLSGKVLAVDEHKLVIDTEYGGRLVLDRGRIKTFRSEQALLIKTQEGQLLTETIESGQAGYVQIAEQSVAIKDIKQLHKPKPLVTDLVWDGNVDLALNYKNGESDSENYALDIATKARHEQWRHNADAKYRREFKDDVRTTDNWGAEYALDRFMGERWFWQNRLSYKRDHVEDIAEQRSFGSGPGFQFWDNELGAFSLASLINRSDYDYRDEGSEHFYSLGAKWDYRRNLISRSIQLFANGEVGKPLSSVADYSFETALGMRYKITDWASLNLRAEKDLVSGAKGDLDETRYSIGFGVGW